ncbi:hypothetical protein PFICI_00955 [Pestalotiopsis fici W106-1]|uniref:Uncharacterized protein n=1 Tax=Pestalotiopsis fici (strain W106-1 / CGMCC3.15140) TaxID=1229662 RepID=W3XNP0_PESFW|nr:uncharacterized protein PFICI_00955 [Pestalotiopsis fici W106-1]ETS87127.1 hypothetical protein PFICI_00955 [Pestalotiopsis fici W106-1]
MLDDQLPLTWLPASVPLAAWYQPQTVNPHGDQIFGLGDMTFLATTSAPEVSWNQFSVPFVTPAIHIITNETVITGDFLQDELAAYFSEDDVLTDGFSAMILMESSLSFRMDNSAETYISSIDAQLLFVPTDSDSPGSLVPGPVLVVADGSLIHVSKVFRLYQDIYRDFVDGIYISNGTFKPLGFFDPAWSNPLVPVPSRLYSKFDPRPLAGQRVGVKDIYDIEGLVTTCGSRAYTAVTPPSNTTAPSIQRLIDLGAVIVGKQKTAQFASAARGWEWTDAYFPQNRRGDGLLSCSASSSGGGCSIAAYDWLDYAIGTDTGQSVRQPAAFSGTFGNRPSQGLMSLEHVMPISYGTDTAGFFCRDPIKWAEAAKYWYDASLQQDSALNGLSELDVPDTDAYPVQILYPLDHLPLQNPEAEKVLQSFLGQIIHAFNMSIATINLTQTIESTTGRDMKDILADLRTLWTHDQLKDVAVPLLEKYHPEFPPLDRPHRTDFRNATWNDTEYAEAMLRRREDADKWGTNILFSTPDSCSESVIIYDIGTGGLPSFRELDLNHDTGAALPADSGTREAGSIVASYFGLVDFTLPIGQVTYYSQATYEEVFMPVSINMIAKRGCDKVMWNFVRRLAEKGILRAVQTGKQAFQE